MSIIRNAILIEAIEALPPLPRTILDVQRVASDKEASIMDMSNVIKNDPMSIANLLKAANSPLYSRRAKDVEMVEQAVSLFGIPMTKCIVVNSTIKRLIQTDVEPYGVSPDEFSKASQIQATILRLYYSVVDGDLIEKLFLPALLQEIGKIIISKEIIKMNETSSFGRQIKEDDDVSVVERSYFGASTQEVTSQMLSYWNFNQEFIDLILHSENVEDAPDDIKPLCASLALSKILAPIRDPLNESSIQSGIDFASNNSLDTSLVTDVVEKIRSFLEDDSF